MVGVTLRVSGVEGALNATAHAAVKLLELLCGSPSHHSVSPPSPPVVVPTMVLPTTNTTGRGAGGELLAMLAPYCRAQALSETHPLAALLRVAETGAGEEAAGPRAAAASGVPLPSGSETPVHCGSGGDSLAGTISHVVPPSSLEGLGAATGLPLVGMLSQRPSQPQKRKLKKL